MDEEQIRQIEQEIFERSRRGERPSWDEYAQRYPEIADSLEEIFERILGEETIVPGSSQPDEIAATEAFSPASEESKTTNAPPDTVSKVAEEQLGFSLRADGRPDAAPADDYRKFGAYELLGELARGGMGVVYRARQIDLDRPVALKMILSGELAGPEDVKRFYAEARSAAALDHPGIVPVFHFGECEGRHFYSMGLIEGESLAALLKKKTFSPREAVQTLRQIVGAVSYAHEQGVIHRDLKPANVLVDLSGKPRVTDFGLAKRESLDSGLTISGQVMGTPQYMPPEQAAGKIDEIDVTSDVYSLGAMLYEMLVGRPPFRGATPVETLRQVREDEPVAPSRLNPAVDRDLETICLKCLSKERKDRYPTADALGEELDRYLDGRPIEARRIGALMRSVRWCRRRPLQASFVATAVLLIAFVGAFVVANRRAERTLQVSNLKSTIAAQLDLFDGSPAELANLERLVEALRYLSPADAKTEDERLTGEIAAAIEANLQQNAIADDDAMLRDAINWVRNRDDQLGQRLDASWRARLADWRELIHVTAPIEEKEVVATFGTHAVSVENGAINRAGSGEDRVMLDAACPTTAELEVAFGGDWKESDRIGILLNVEKGRGYEFVVGVPSANGERATAKRSISALAPDEELFVEVRKAGSVLQRSVISAGQLSGDEIALRARRESNQLVFQVMGQSPIQVQDVFASSSARGSFGLVWPSEATVVSLQARYRELPSEPRPIEKADQYMESNELAEALPIYQRLARESASPDAKAEADYKTAICLLKLNRRGEAVELLDEMSPTRTEPWGLLAASQLWLLHLQKRELAEADLIADELSANYTFENLAAAIPSEQRKKILEAIFSRRLDAKTVEGLSQVERAMTLDRLLSVDGRGEFVHQENCVKAVELAGRVDYAETLWKRLLNDFPAVSTSYYRLSAIARSKGDFNESLRYIALGDETFRDAGHSLPSFALRLERIRTTSAMGELERSLQYLDELELELENNAIHLEENPDSKLECLTLKSHMALLRGFALDDLGRGAEAAEVWREGYLETRGAIGQVDAADTWLVINALLLGSLSGDLKQEDIPGLVVMLSGVEMPQQVAKIAVSQIGQDVVHQTLLQTWRRPDAKEIARDGYALHQLSYRERYLQLVRRTGVEFFRQTAFPAAELSEPQKRILESGVDELILLIESKKLSMIDLMGLAMAWRQPGVNGRAFDPFVGRWPDRAVGHVSYLIAHRLSLEGEDEMAVLAWMDRAIAKVGEDEGMKSQLGIERDEIRSQRGQLTIVNPLPRDVQIDLQGANGFHDTVTVQESKTWSLASGEYQFRLLGEAEARLSTELATVRPLSPQTAIVQSRWTPGEPAESWPGIVPLPAKLSGVKRWQLVPIAPLSSLSVVSASRDGSQIAIGGRDGVLRIYNDLEGKLSHWLPGHATRLSSVSWSDEGDEVLTTSFDGSVQLWSLKGPRLLTSLEQPNGVVGGAISPDGAMFATGSYDRIIRIWSRDGALYRQYADTSSQAISLCWTKDGRHLVSGDSNGRLHVWNVDEAQPQVQLEYDRPVSFVSSLDRQQLAVWESQGGKIDLIDAKSWRVAGAVETNIAAIRSVAWVDDGANLAVLGRQGELQIHRAGQSEGEPEKGAPLYTTKSSETNDLTQLGANRLACVGDNGACQIRDTKLKPTEAALAPAKLGVNFLGWRPNHDQLAVGCADGRFRVFDSSGAQVRDVRSGSSCVSAAWSADGERLAVAQWNNEIVVYHEDLTSFLTIAENESRTGVAWTPQGSLLTASDYGEVRRYADLSEPARTLATLNQRITSSLCASADALFFSSQFYSLNRIGLSDPSEMREVKYRSPINAVAADHTSDWIAASNGPLIEIFTSAELAKPTPTPLVTCRDGVAHVRNLAWSNDGKHLYSLLDYGWLQKWDRTGKVVMTMNTRSQLIPELFAISADLSIAVMGSDVPFITFVDLRTGTAMFSLVMLKDGQVAKIYPGGYCPDSPDLLDDSMVCVVLKDDGTVVTQVPSQFLKR